MKKTLCLICFNFLFSTSLFAANKKTTKQVKYGTAGCGLGALIFGSKPGMIQIVAATFNSTFANQTFGITSGTSNCAHKPTRSAVAKVFIEANKVALQNDSARGYGETLDSLLEIYSCDESARTDVQSHYKFIFSTNDVDYIESAIAKVLRNNSCLS